MPSFDVISKINYQEFDNALANCLREIGNRYDFKGLHISIERKDKTITTDAHEELKLNVNNNVHKNSYRVRGKGFLFFFSFTSIF